MLHIHTYRLVLAEDDTDDSYLFSQALNESRHEANLKIVRDGEKLLEYLSKLPEEELPHLIFLDLHLPRKNGIQCIKELRSDKRYNAIPIIMFTSSGLPPDIEASAKYGANMYIRKSDNFKTFVNTLDGLLTDNGYEYLLMQQSNKIS
jgi:CheY-like chemotaxis protein